MKKYEHWHRDEPRFYDLLALERAPIDAPDGLAGLKGAMMSRDLKSGSVTWVVEIPPGWRSRSDAKAGTIECFLLRGDLSLGDSTVGSSGYVQLAQGCGGGELRSTNGALAIVFWNPNLPGYPYPITRNRTCNPWTRDWVNSMPGAHGVMHKSLRLPDSVPHPTDEGFDGGPGGYLRLQYIAPQMIADMEHVHHECWEEIVLLQGDVLLLNEGQMGIGSVVSHPQEWYHAPFTSRSGAVILVHTDAPMGYPWPPRPYPQGRSLCECYLADSRWDVPTQHVPWSAHPLAEQQEADPAYQAWRRTREGSRWGGYESTNADVPHRPGGRGTATDFRASWKREC